MNEKAVEVLVGAAMRGVRQIKGAFSDANGGRCALGVLGVGMNGDLIDTALCVRWYGMRQHGHACPHGCRGYSDVAEQTLIAHLNDDHDADFLTIARKLGPDA